jgi:4-amino-4-deoxy-L-arabinose transferase-like glycosyltransferase
LPSRTKFDSSVNRLAACIILYFVLLAVATSAATPPFEAPDEGSHFLYIHNLLETHQLPVLEDKAATYASKSVQRHHPPLYYLVGAALISWTQRGDVVNTYLQDNPYAAIGTVTDNNQNVYLHSPNPPPDQTITAVWILRLYSMALGAGTLVFVYLTGKLAFGARVGLLAMLLVASMPMFVFISASVNNDNLVTLCYAAGVYWSLRLWRQRTISRRDVIVTGVILSGAALSKLTGLTLFGVLYLAVLWGAYRRTFTWRQAITLIAGSLAMAALLAGWWYLRNWSLYGDPLALQATLRVWARGPGPAAWSVVLGDLKGVWESLWMILGHFNVRGPDWLYVYADVISMIGVLGIALAFLTKTMRRRLDISLFLLLVCAVVFVSFAFTTRQINVSQGRILFPALAAFAPLLVMGWESIFRRGGSKTLPYTAILLLPLVVVALVTPVKYLPRSYAPLVPVSAVPADARRIDAHADDLSLLAYQLEGDTLAPGGEVRLWVYFSGSHPENPALFVTALDPAGEPIGQVTTYPGMAATTDLPPNVIYRAPVVFTLKDTPSKPFQLRLALGWHVPGANAHDLQLVDASGVDIGGLIVPGATVIDPSYKAPAPQVAADVVYGDAIRLKGYTLSAQQVAPGGSLTVTLDWGYVAPVGGDYSVALGLLDDADHVLVNADGYPDGYPTSAWRPAPDFPDTRILKIPADAPPGDYRLYVGWYRLSDGDRLPLRGDGAQGTLYIAPMRIGVGK